MDSVVPRKIFKKVRGKLRRRITGHEATKMRDYIRNEAKKPQSVRLIDKVSFCLGIFYLMISEFVLLSVPEQFHIWYSIAVIVLLGLRFRMYKKVKYEFFMIDFCYFVNLLCLIFFVYPHPVLFQVLFLFANGPLATAIYTWRNSLVFHNLDKLTSLFIHIGPPLVTLTHKYYRAPDMEYPSLFSSQVLVSAMVIYTVWQICYLLITQILFTRSEEYGTSIRHFCRTRNGTYEMFRSLFTKMGALKPGEHIYAHEIKGQLIFVCGQLVYTTVALLPAFIVCWNRALQSIELLLVLVIAIYNGASFYVEVFSRTYSLPFMRMGDRWCERVLNEVKAFEHEKEHPHQADEYTETEESDIDSSNLDEENDDDDDDDIISTDSAVDAVVAGEEKNCEKKTEPEQENEEKSTQKKDDKDIVITAAAEISIVNEEM
eukprot:TRINITY_DN2691_c0_g2_i1.p1 TRINITY_DN2691_c0_g2~~TRINITY_DN2691_c0_g2_i1.p1  ORF type:complete len:430 (+),score=95.83 TRINITY_DN2691_c0_g2_i1:94-1383(+)